MVALNLPHPTFNGLTLRNWQNVNGLRRVSRVGVFGVCPDDRLRERPPPADLAFWRSSTDPALRYPPPKGVRIAARGWLLEPRGHPFDLYYSDGAAAELATLLAEFDPDIAVLEGLWPYRYLDILKRHRCRIILDCHNIEAPLAQQLADAPATSDAQVRFLRAAGPQRTNMIERAATQAADQIWVCSDHDLHMMQQWHAPARPIHVVPNAVDVRWYAPRPESATAAAAVRKTLIFPAMFSFPPNAAAAAFLTTEVFPRLAKVASDCQLLLVGCWPAAPMLAAAKADPRIVVTGAVPDIRPYLAAASGMAVPLFQGGGSRFKILEAFAAHLPVISTAKGAEGLAVRDGEHLLIAERAEEFVEGVLRVWADARLAQRLTANAADIVERYYSWEVVGRRIAAAVHELCGGD